jgi:selenocysteine-specific elongation factor
MATPAASVININIGVVGHVDSGKTSLVRALSTLVSTAALDKNPQSQARGITLDLGFSSFAVPCPPRLAHSGGGEQQLLQFTLVDCPGHASLIRTIIGGAQIIDMMLLVVDVVKGVQTQTAECLVVGEICTERLVVVLNKTDLLPEATRAAAVDRAAARVRKALAGTRFAAAPVLALAAAPGGAGKLGAGSPEAPTGAEGNASVAALVQHLVDTVELPQRAAGGPFLFAIDHCACANWEVGCGSGRRPALLGQAPGTCPSSLTLSSPSLTPPSFHPPHLRARLSNQGPGHCAHWHCALWLPGAE